VRLDRYLFFIRLVKSRTLAQGLIEQGHVRIDGKRVEKPSEEVRVGSVIALPLHGQVRILRVTSLPARRGPAAEARLAYEEIDVNPAAT
jgi:ribosome-associated heat shock protein Hsp15